MDMGMTMAGAPLRAGPRRSAAGFTLIELLVVLAVTALLASIAAPRYLGSIDRAKETALRQSLVTLREAIDQFNADQRRYPASLEELVRSRYLRRLPDDPITGRADSWQVLPPPPDDVLATGVWDVRSGAVGKGLDGIPYADW